ncbi:MAG: hypothetical protein R2823_06155 [Acidimicrobiia bacterium]
MLPLPSRTDLRRRLPQLVVGLFIFGVGVALQVVSELGLSPWEILHQGLSEITGIPLGTVGILVGMLVLLLWIPLKERFGIGTVLNVMIIGLVIDLSLWRLPEHLDNLAIRSVVLVTGITLVGFGSGMYIGAGLGPGPRDGLMTGLAKRGINIGVARFGIEISVMVVGWMLGGTLGIGTALFALGMGPLIALFLPLFQLEPLVAEPADSHWGTIQ